MPVLTKKKKEYDVSLKKWLIAAAAPVLGCVLYLFFSTSKSRADLAVKYFSSPVKNALGAVSTLFPFSVMELLYVIAGVFLIVFLTRTVLIIIREKRRLKILLKRGFILLVLVLYILSGYLCLWGIDYQSSSFRDKTGLDSSAVSTEELFLVTRYFVLKASSLSDTVARDENGQFAADREEYFSYSVHIYDTLLDEFDCLCGVSRVPKQMVFSQIMSRMGFTGVFFPFTGESNINVAAPEAFIPMTIAHELAHQQGVYSEQECNFLGVLACVTSDNETYTYSGYLAGSLYLMNALYKADRDLWRSLRSEITGTYLTDWENNSDYWNSMESKVTTVSEAVYDGYLKATGDELGIRSYGACVNLLVNYFYGRI